MTVCATNLALIDLRKNLFICPNTNHVGNIIAFDANYMIKVKNPVISVPTIDAPRSFFNFLDQLPLFVVSNFLIICFS